MAPHKTLSTIVKRSDSLFDPKQIASPGGSILRIVFIRIALGRRLLLGLLGGLPRKRPRLVSLAAALVVVLALHRLVSAVPGLAIFECCRASVSAGTTCAAAT